jgi:hypothetical protein
MGKRGRMISVYLAVCLSVAVRFAAAETVVKSSAPFSFPITVGISGNNLLQSANEIFLYNSHMAGNKTVELSWSLPVMAKTGTISIFTVAGVKVKTFAITSRSGRVVWDLTQGRIGKGVYCATISYGPSTKNLKLVIY